MAVGAVDPLKTTTRALPTRRQGGLVVGAAKGRSGTVPGSGDLVGSASAEVSAIAEQKSLASLAAADSVNRGSTYAVMLGYGVPRLERVPYLVHLVSAQNGIDGSVSLSVQQILRICRPSQMPVVHARSVVAWTVRCHLWSGESRSRPFQHCGKSIVITSESPG